MGVDWDEFERRGEERRERRDYKRTDRVSVALGALLFGLIVFWVVWGLLS